MKKLFLTTLALSMFAVTFGQDTTKTVELESITVIGVRADEKTPVSQKTVTQEDIQSNYQGQEMSFILDRTPSITSSTDAGNPQGYTYFRLRGIDQTRINMTLNGVPLNEPEDQGVYFSNYPGFANNIKSMQIQRGVGTSANGVASYAGSINFESRNGLKRGSEVQMGGGSFGTRRLTINNSTGLSDKGYALYSSVSTFETDGYRYHTDSRGHSIFLSGGYYGDGEIVKVTAFTGRAFNNMAWLAVSEDDIANNPRTNYNSRNADDDFMQSFAQLQYTKSLSNKSTLVTTGYYNRLDGNWDLDLNSIGAGSDILNYQLGSNFYGIMSNLNYKEDSLQVNFGVHASKYERDHAMAVLPDATTTVYNNTGFKDQASSYLKVAYDWNKWTFFGDGQIRYATFKYDGDVDMEDVEWTFFNPKVGATYQQSENISYYASVGQSHREPTRTDMFGGEDNLITFTNVNPEEVIDYELGLNYKGDKLEAQANIYYMDFENEITLLGALGSNGLPLMTNVENSFRSGLEVDASYPLNKEVKLVNSSSYSYSKIIDNGVEFEPLYTPDLIINQGVEYSKKRLKAGLYIKHHSESYIDLENKFTTPSFIVLNASVGYEYKGYSLLVQLNNLTDEEYYTNGYAIDGTRYFYVNPPLSAYATLRVNF